MTLERFREIIKKTAKIAITLPAAFIVLPLGIIIGGPSGTGSGAFALIMVIAGVAFAMICAGFGLSLLLNLFGLPWFITFPAIYLGICLWYAFKQSK